MSAAGGSTATLTDAPRWDPGTDAVLLLAMANVLFADGLRPSRVQLAGVDELRVVAKPVSGQRQCLIRVISGVGP